MVATVSVPHNDGLALPTANSTKQFDNTVTSRSSAEETTPKSSNGHLGDVPTIVSVQGYCRQRPKHADQNIAPKYDGNTIKALIQQMLRYKLENEGIDDVVLDYLERIAAEFLDDCQAGLKAIDSSDDRDELLDMFISCIPGLTLDTNLLDGFLHAALVLHTRSFPCPNLVTYNPS